MHPNSMLKRVDLQRKTKKMKKHLKMNVFVAYAILKLLKPKNISWLIVRFIKKKDWSFMNQ